MKIIVPGTKPSTEKMFECNICGCVFLADKNEYKAITQYNDTSYIANCPERGCGGTGHEISEARKQAIGRAFKLDYTTSF